MKRWFKATLGILVGGLFLWLALRGVNPKEVAIVLKQAKSKEVALSALAMILATCLRSLRWQVVLNPVERLNQRLLFPISQVGYMAAVLLPARLGELARPAILAKRSRVPFSKGLGAVVLERGLDCVVIGVLLILTLNINMLPAAIRIGAGGFAALVALGLLVLVTAYLKQETVMGILTNPPRFLPSSLARGLKDTLKSFISGLSILGSPLEFVAVGVLTILIWIAIAFSFYFIFGAFSLKLPFQAAVTVLSITALGVAVPTAPGFVGNFHFFFVVGLTLFGATKDGALAVAILSHALNVGVQVALGLIFLPVVGARLGEIVAEEESP